MTIDVKTDRTINLMSVDWPERGLEEVFVCPVCGEKDRTTLYTDLVDLNFHCAPGQWALHQCTACQSAYLDPRPTQDTIHLAYKTYFTHSSKVRQPTQQMGRLRKLARALANSYRNARTGSRLEPSNRLGNWVIHLMPSTRERLDRESRYLPELVPNGRLLDVGFGSGSFLDFAQRIGWEVSGVDPDPVAVKNAAARGLNVQQGGIEDISREKGKFDVITLSHVIEHVHNPRVVIEKAFDLLKPGGLLYLDTPNIESVGHKRLGPYWLHLDPPRHIVLFSWDALSGLLQKCGFHPLFLKPSHYKYAEKAGKTQAIFNKTDNNRPARCSGDTFLGFINSLSIIVDYRKSEFITLIAHKPL